MSYGIYICVQDLFLSYRSYSGVTELILVFRILFFCEGTRRYDKSEQIRIIDSLYGSNRSYDWTYQIQDLSDTGLIRYRSYHIQDLLDTGLIRYRTYQRQVSDTGLIKYWNTRRYYRTYTETELIRYRSTRRYYRTYTETELIRYRSTRRYYRTYTETGLIG